MNQIIVREETARDIDAVRAIVTAAFEQDAEAVLVDALRTNNNAIISLVAEEGDFVAGHILFSPVSVEVGPAKVLGLAPLSVAPGSQRSGIGGALMRDGLARATALGYDAVVLLGHPEYYPRFGFTPASRFGIRCEYDSPDEAFMAIELHPGALKDTRGLAKYGPEFAAF